MKSGEQLLEIELGSKTSKCKKYKKLYGGMCNRIVSNLKTVKDEFELIEKFKCSLNEFRTDKENKNKLFYNTLKTGKFDVYNTFFIMKDCFEKFDINVNLVSIKSKHFIKTDNYLLTNGTVVEFDEFPLKTEISVINDYLVKLIEYNKLSKFYRNININKSKEYLSIINETIDRFHENMEIMKYNYGKLSTDIVNKIWEGYEDYEINFIIGEIFQREKKYKIAEHEFRKIIPVNKYYKNVQEKIAYCLFKQNKYNEALMYYENVIEKDYNVLLHMGICNYKIKNIDKAIELFTEVLMINERCKEGYINLAISNLKKNNYEEARRIIQLGNRYIGHNKEFEKILKNISKKENLRRNVIINEDETYSIFKEVKA